jgi:hypothetical protein
MGILNMSPLDWTTRVMEFSQTSLENTLHTVKEVHQTMAEIPLNVAQEFGMSKDTSTALKYIHRRVLDHMYDGIGNAVGEVNQYVVKQAQNIDRLTNFDRVPEETAFVNPGSREEPQEEIQLN